MPPPPKTPPTHHHHSELFGDGTGDHTLLYIHSYENPSPPHLKPADRRRVTDGNGTQSRLPRERHRSVERGFSRYLGSLYCMHYHGDYFVRISFVCIVRRLEPQRLSAHSSSADDNETGGTGRWCRRRRKHTHVPQRARGHKPVKARVCASPGVICAEMCIVIFTLESAQHYELL